MNNFNNNSTIFLEKFLEKKEKVEKKIRKEVERPIIETPISFINSFLKIFYDNKLTIKSWDDLKNRMPLKDIIIYSFSKNDTEWLICEITASISRFCNIRNNPKLNYFYNNSYRINNKIYDYKPKNVKYFEIIAINKFLINILELNKLLKSFLIGNSKKYIDTYKIEFRFVNCEIMGFLITLNTFDVNKKLYKNPLEISYILSLGCKDGLDEFLKNNINEIFIKLNNLKHLNKYETDNKIINKIEELLENYINLGIYKSSETLEDLNKIPIDLLLTIYKLYNVYTYEEIVNKVPYKKYVLDLFEVFDNNNFRLPDMFNKNFVVDIVSYNLALLFCSEVECPYFKYEKIIKYKQPLNKIYKLILFLYYSKFSFEESIIILSYNLKYKDSIKIQSFIINEQENEYYRSNEITKNLILFSKFVTVFRYGSKTYEKIRQIIDMENKYIKINYKQLQQKILTDKYIKELFSTKYFQSVISLFTISQKNILKIFYANPDFYDFFLNHLQGIIIIYKNICFLIVNCIFSDKKVRKEIEKEFKQ